MKRIEIAFSPCPNDCFIFDALIHKRIDTHGYEFIPVLADVETLNMAAFEERFDVTKISYHAFAYCIENYVMLTSGSALGHNCGPLLISKREISQAEIAKGDLSIAIPGKFTTANFLFGLAFPEAKKKLEMTFSMIEDAVLSEGVDAGVIIHENRFTYEQKGLRKIIDLGEWWEKRTARAIPLGGIAIKRSFSHIDQVIINDLVRKSVRFALENPEIAMPYVREHAQEMDEKVMKQHINLYVNQWTVDVGIKGEYAADKMFELGRIRKIIPESNNRIFVMPLPEE
jgi:1,4-dihydroxy-6-naphthoate synthase